MSLLSSSRRLSATALLLAAAGACRHGPTDARPPASIEAVSALAFEGAVGQALAQPIAVVVRDASGAPLPGAFVTFAVTFNNGSTSPRVAVTNGDGIAQTTWTLGLVAGPNEVTASLEEITGEVRFTATASPGPVMAVAITPTLLRFPVGVDSLAVAGVARDQFGNAVTPADLVVRDPTLVEMSGNYLRVLKRGGTTYLVGSSGALTDSVHVVVLAPGDPPCTGFAAPVALLPGQAIDASPAGACVSAGTSGAEYVLMAYYNTPIPSATSPIEVRGFGLVPFGTSTAAPLAVRSAAPWDRVSRDSEFDLALRRRERAEMRYHVENARAWRDARLRAGGSVTSPAADGPAGPGPAMGAAVAANVPAVGTLMNLNANAFEFCTNPSMRTGRVMAVTDRAVVVADTANPAGGFTAQEYASIGATFDTLVYDVSVEAFGAPTDLDNNGGRTILFFTRAVNALSPQGSGSIVLGFFYSRDLLPKLGPKGSCPGSNVAEIMYLLVPDPSDPQKRFEKEAVRAYSNGTAAHEFQHLINSGRRLYVNNATASDEEVWLNEGLSHIAEELVFFRSAGLAPRQKLGAAILADQQVADAMAAFQLNNLRRYRVYLAAPREWGPVGFSATADNLATRGAIWAFLRYAADQRPGGDGTLWYDLVNAKNAGLQNLAAALGTPPGPLMRDWAMAVYADDLAAGLDVRHTQPSWNFRSILPASSAGSFNLNPLTLQDGVGSNVTIRGGGAGHFRFAVPAGGEALLRVTSSGLAPISSMQFTILRTK